ncbi:MULTISPECIES: helix-turn-helix transcriptional regulator [Vagococcus]|uniref:Uncharacterized HTH-type transcriptional regulator MJ0272 n=1 Tax=Vagococcus fluvialis bH819 TaxID=1255619 RepID=A0A1X6WMX0_9ENTE|nr:MULTISPECIES: helix-turn-helix transcriptional regulator [Vagococcus]SLM85673.1 Uncharacterized HTH-type transcriptional regulator MJ0272 [Vagococcus fluvialis bH819]HCM89640.1 transcriptional regulator [Vagococcus sp.]
MIQNNIKVYRAKNNWTQEDLAKKVGVSRQAIISIEKYKYLPSLELAFKIAKVFQEDISQIFIYEEELS